jgi:REP element-mobilizing transposase RayT
MGFHYKIHDNSRPYFITSTVVDWIDLFSRKNHKITVVESLRHCQKEKGLEIYAWCLMLSHLHMIVRAGNGALLSDIMRDFKSFTSKQLILQIKKEPESRREWLLKSFSTAAMKHPKTKYYKVWQDGFHPIELYTPKFTKQKLDYIHNNPVEEMLVSAPHEYLYSSARNYADMNGLINVIRI